MMAIDRTRKVSEPGCFSPSATEEMRQKKDERPNTGFPTGHGMAEADIWTGCREAAKAHVVKAAGLAGTLARGARTDAWLADTSGFLVQAAA